MAEHRISNDIPIYPWVAWRSHIRCAPWWSYAKDRQWIATGATSWMAEAIHVYRGNCGCKTVLKWWWNESRNQTVDPWRLVVSISDFDNTSTGTVIREDYYLQALNDIYITYMGCIVESKLCFVTLISNYYSLSFLLSKYEAVLPSFLLALFGSYHSSIASCCEPGKKQLQQQEKTTSYYRKRATILWVLPQLVGFTLFPPFICVIGLINLRPPTK